MLGRIRIAASLQRWELLLGALAIIGLSTGMLFVAWQLREVVANDPTCFVAEPPERCRDLMEQFGNLGGLGGQLLTYSAIGSMALSVILGVPIVSREIEHGTAPIAWALTTSRLRWLLWRVAIIGGCLVAVLAVGAVASTILAASLLPDSNAGADFSWYGQRGSLLIVRGLLGFAIGVLAGAFVGRQLPALLLTLAVTAATFLGANLVLDRWLMTDAIPARFALPNQEISFNGSRSLGGFMQLTSGEIVTGDELAARGYALTEGSWDYERDEFYATPQDRIAKRNLLGWHVDLLVPGSKYPVAVGKESVLLGGLFALGIGLAAVIVRQRRPY